MVTVYPFRGLRYNLERINSLTKVVCPPYDTISPEEQKFYYHIHPANIIRLELPQGHPPGKYQQAKKEYQNWLKQEILVSEQQPAFYLCQQDFVFQDRKLSRIGFFAALKLELWGKGIFPHEKTFLQPKLDRLELLRHLKANISPIFALFSNTEKKFFSFAEKEVRKKPLFKFSDTSNWQHRLWQISDPEKISYLQELFRNKKIYIADGHHRYETAFTYANEQRKTENEKRCILTYLCPMEQGSLLMLPTYRVIKGKWGVGDGRWEEWKKEKEKYFRLLPLKNEKEMFNRLKQNIALYSEGKYFLLRLKPEGEKTLKRMLPHSPSVYRNLGVIILDRLLLEKVRKDKLIYSQNFRETINYVNKGIGKVAFFFNSPKVSILKTIAKTGEIMPEKSTYFYPKVPTGLVIYSLEDTDCGG